MKYLLNISPEKHETLQIKNNNTKMINIKPGLLQLTKTKTHLV